MNSVPSEIFKAMSVETRVNIIELLKIKGPLGGNKIAELIGISPAAVSQHLKILRQAGLVTGERDGFWIPYSIDETGMEKCRRAVHEVCSCGCEGMGKVHAQELNEASLASLETYARELENELEEVRKRIAEMTDQS